MAPELKVADPPFFFFLTNFFADFFNLQRFTISYAIKEHFNTRKKRNIKRPGDSSARQTINFD